MRLVFIVAFVATASQLSAQFEYDRHQPFDTSCEQLAPTH
jgi:hypothetical protein